MYFDLLHNIIIGKNELHVCKYLLDLDLTLMNIWKDKYCLENDYDSKTKLSIILSILQYIMTVPNNLNLTKKLAFTFLLLTAYLCQTPFGNRS